MSAYGIFIDKLHHIFLDCREEGPWAAGTECANVTVVLSIQWEDLIYIKRFVLHSINGMNDYLL